jgi:hypothetical protein
MEPRWQARRRTKQAGASPSPPYYGNDRPRLRTRQPRQHVVLHHGQDGRSIAGLANAVLLSNTWWTGERRLPKPDATTWYLVTLSSTVWTADQPASDPMMAVDRLAEASRFYAQLYRHCVVSLHTVHIGSGTCLALSGRGPGTQATVAPVPALHFRSTAPVPGRLPLAR